MFDKLRAALGKKTSSGGASFSWLVVGLGNPGRQYENNRHNIGFMAVDRIADDHKFGPWRTKFSAQIADGTIDGQRVMLMKPQTYMNKSGQAVADAARFYKIAPARIIVMHDELDLPPGKIRVKTGGGAAGHNGLKSIDADLGDQNYHRVRIGIGHPGDKARVSGYVLSDFASSEAHVTDLTMAAISRHMDVLLDGHSDDFMTRISEEQR